MKSRIGIEIYLEYCRFRVLVIDSRFSIRSSSDNNAGNYFSNVGNTSVIFVCVHALKTIEKDQEISTNYDSRQGHEVTNICKCDCSRSFTTRQTIFKENQKVMRNSNIELYYQILDKYQRNELTKKMFYIYLIKNDIIMYNAKPLHIDYV